MRRYVAIFCLLLSSCTGLFFHPDKILYSSPGQGGFQFTEFWIEDPGEPRLYGWRIEPKGPRKGAVVHAHGNAQNLSAHMPSAAWLASSGYELFVFDYRGYGPSEGDPEVSGVYRDVKRAIRFAAAAAGSKVAVFGQSLGGALSLAAVADSQIAGSVCAVVAESPFFSYRQIAREKMSQLWLLYPLQWPLSLLFTDRHAPLNTAADITVPVFLAHSKSDEVVPFHHSVQLMEQLRGAEFMEVEGASHLAVFSDKQRQLDALRFLAAYCQKTAALE